MTCHPPFMKKQQMRRSIVGTVMAIPLLAATLKAQDIYVGSGLDTIGEYSLSGTTVNAPLISGLRFPSAIAISGNNLFIVNRLSNTIGEYTTFRGDSQRVSSFWFKLSLGNGDFRGRPVCRE
jgi:hypothetical protein